MKRFTAFVYFLVLALVFSPVPIFAGAGMQIGFLLSQVRYASGTLAGGKAYFYEAGTTTNKAVYTDIGLTTPAANPYTLDANGTALLYGNGTYRVVIKTSALATVYDRDNVRFEDILGGIAGNGTGNITGYDNLTITGKATIPTLVVTTLDNITTANITTANVTTANITTGNITNLVVTDNTPTFVDNTVNGADLIDNTITNAKFIDNTINGTKMLDNTISLTKLVNGGTTVAQLSAFKNLKVTTPADNQSVTITADKVVATDNTDTPKVLSTVSLTVNLDNAGANGLDSGSLAANTGYYLYVIDNGATTAGLASTSATTPVMPTGYTYKALVGWCTTDNTATPFNIKEFEQQDDVYIWNVVDLIVDDMNSTDTVAVNLSAGGVKSYAEVPPLITKEVIGRNIGNGASTGHWFASNSTFGNSTSMTDTAIKVAFTSSSGGWGYSWQIGPITNSTFYHQISVNGCDVYLSGFTLKR